MSGQTRHFFYLAQPYFNCTFGAAQPGVYRRLGGLTADRRQNIKTNNKSRNSGKKIQVVEDSTARVLARGGRLPRAIWA